jgi:hypothetical protein
MTRILDALKVAFNKRPDWLEMKVLNSLVEALSPEAADILRKQIAAINSIKRVMQRRKVSLYHIKYGKTPWEDIVAFPRKNNEIKLATIFLTYGESERLVADIWLINGYAFLIKFDKPPQKVGKVEDVNVSSVQLHTDPMISIQDEPQEEFTSDEKIPALSEWLQEWNDKYELRILYKPKTLNCRTHRLKELETEFPKDYLELLNQMDGFVILNNSVFGIDEIYHVILDDGDYYLIAEVACGEDRQGSLGVVAGSNDRHIYYLAHDGSEPEDKGTSFQKAMEEFLG